MRFEGLGYCWADNRCDWWNPPIDLLFEALSIGMNFCIECWKFKK